MLESIGLDELAERVYRLLIRQESLTAAALAAQLELPPARARQVLDGLVAAGLATGRPGRPMRYAAVDPRTGLHSLIRSRQAELDRVAWSIEAYAADYHERVLRTDPGLLVEVVEGQTEITRRVEQLIASAEKEVVAFDAPPYVSGDSRGSEAEQEVLARGVSVRAVYASEVVGDPLRARQLSEMVALGEQARVLPRVPTKLVVVDRCEAILPLTGSEEGRRTTAAFVRRSGLSDALVELFEAHWVLAVPVYAAPNAASGLGEAELPAEVSPEDRALLQLLNAGLKDEAIARQLDMSLRTFRRRMAELNRRLGATSRFQAGTQAMRRGWL